MDTVSDALIRIKNAYLAQKRETVLPYSKLIKSICDVLQKEGYVAEVKEVKDGSHPNLAIVLKYDNEHSSSSNKKAALTNLKRISKPGLRVYKSKTALPYVLNGLGIAIVSTPKGVMTDKQARKEGVGGEILAYVW